MKEFVFIDEQGRRWQRLRILVMVLGSLFLVGSVLFIRTLFVAPNLLIPATIQQLQDRLKALEQQESGRKPRASNRLWLAYMKEGDKASQRSAKAMPAPDDSDRDVLLGLAMNGEQRSLDSLKAHADQITHVGVEWLTLVDGEGSMTALPDSELSSFARSKSIVLLPILNNLVNDTWQPEAVEGLAGGPVSVQERFIAELLRRIEASGGGGVLVDWGQVDPEYRNALTLLLKKMSEALHDKGLALWLCIPMGQEIEVFDLEALGSCVDRFVAMLHDESSENDSPGPIASTEWFQGWLETTMGYVDPDQLIISLGSYGYDWPVTESEKKAECISFADAMSRAGHAGLSSIGMEDGSQTPSFSYQQDGIEHVVWLLDVATFLNQLRLARDEGIGGIALCQLGYEDPAVWKALRAGSLEDLVSEGSDGIGVIPSDSTISHVGKGEFITVNAMSSAGRRRIELDASGRFVESYEKLPRYLTICHQGYGAEDEVAITFDDGPDPKWTPAILDILRERNVKACFFVIGGKVEKYPSIVKRIIQEGHEIGVHTYSHPNLANVSEERMSLELNATQWLIKLVTGRSSILFRPPYSADSRPRSISEIVPIICAQRLGYLTVTENIDPEDWARPGEDAIVERVRQGRRSGGDVILLHDSGGDRRQTVEALPRIIDYLEAREDRIVSLSRMLGQSDEFVMPPVKPDEQSITATISGSGFRFLHLVEELLWSFMVVATALVILRTLAIAFLALLHRRKELKEMREPFHPPLSVLLPAYNEEKVIGRTLKHVLCSEYPGEIELIVVDDGSQDGTSRVVSEYAAKDPRIHLIQQSNRGKPRALRKALQLAKHEILVTLDADTIFSPKTLKLLVAPLCDENVSAVSGYARVGNLRSFIAKCQDLEYTCGFNLDRRAYDVLDCITVAPGAVSALRKSAVVASGGISTDTLAEDTDLTFCLHKAGYRVGYAPKAVAWTEAPETLAALASQRFRWGFGTLQCLWKHLDMVFNPRYKALGCFALPSMWFFQIALVAVIPVVDALLLLSLVLGTGDAVIAYFITFLLMDVFLAALACSLERESMWKVWLIVPMRFMYRPLLSWVIWKAILKALKGAWVSWGKLERTASVTDRA